MKKPACKRVKASAFTRLQAGKGIRLYPYRTPCCHCNHRHIGGNAVAGTLGGTGFGDVIAVYKQPETARLECQYVF